MIVAKRHFAYLLNEACPTLPDALLFSGDISLQAKACRSSARLTEKIANAAFSVFTRYAELAAKLLRNLRDSSNLRHIPPSKKDPFGPSLLGGGGEIRTPATGLPILTI